MLILHLLIQTLLAHPTQDPQCKPTVILRDCSKRISGFEAYYGEPAITFEPYNNPDDRSHNPNIELEGFYSVPGPHKYTIKGNVIRDVNVSGAHIDTFYYMGSFCIENKKKDFCTLFKLQSPFIEKGPITLSYDLAETFMLEGEEYDDIGSSAYSVNMLALDKNDRLIFCFESEINRICEPSGEPTRLGLIDPESFDRELKSVLRQAGCGIQ